VAARPAARSPAPRAERAGPRRPERTSESAGNEAGVELGALVEELLASAALQKDGAPRFHFRSGEPFVLKRPPAGLLTGLGGLVEFARTSAGADGLVRAEIVPGADVAVVRLEFPRANLPEKDLGALLERSTGVDPAAGEGLLAARRAAELLRAAGARVELTSIEPGRVRCEVHVSTRPPAAPRAARAGKAEDPFA
jgi:hypothetical protein